MTLRWKLLTLVALCMVGSVVAVIAVIAYDMIRYPANQ